MTNSHFERGIDPNDFSYEFYFGDGLFVGSAEACFLDAYMPPPTPENKGEAEKTQTTTDKPAKSKDDSKYEKPAEDGLSFKVSAAPVESIEVPILPEFTVEAIEGPMVPQASIASTRAGSYAKFANAENDQARLQASMEYLALIKQTKGQRLNASQQKDLTNIKEWMTSRGESVAYQQWYTASHDTNMKPAAKYAQATQYLQFVSTVYGDNLETYPPQIKEKAEKAAAWHQYIAANSSITVNLDALRKKNGGVLTHEAIANSTAGRLGFKPEDMQPYSIATNGTNRNHAFATSQDKNMTDEQWVASLQDKPSVTIWENNSGDFSRMKVWAQARHALEANLPAAERKLDEAARDMSREDYANARAELNRQRAKLEGKEPLFDEQKGDPRIRELGAAVTQKVDELVAVPLKALDLVTRPFQAASTAVAGTQLVIGDIFGDTLTGTGGDLLKYHFTNLPGAVWERFTEGKTREGFEQPIAQAYGLAAEHFGFDRNSTANKVVRTGLEIFGDPTTYVAPSMFARAGKVAETATAANALRETSVAVDGANALRELPVASKSTHALSEVPITFRAAGESGETLAGLKYRLDSAYDAGSDTANLIMDLDKNPIRARISETGVALEESSTRLELARSMRNPLTDDKIPVVIDGVRTDLKSAQAKFLQEAEARAAGAASTVERPAAAAASDAYRMEPLNPMEQTRFEKLGKKYYETKSLTREEAAEFQSLSQRTRERGPVMISEERASSLRYEPNANFHADASFDPTHFRGKAGDMSAFEPSNGETFSRGTADFQTAKPGAKDFVHDPSLTPAENYAHYANTFLEEVPTDVRIYKLKNSNLTIEVPETLAQKFDEVRALRLEAETSTDLAKVAAAEKRLKELPHGSAVLPEEIAAIVDNLPNKAKLSKIQIFDGPGPQDGFNKFPASADAAASTGNLRFFDSNKDAINILDTTNHEWAHLTQEGSTFSAFDAFKKAESIEDSFHLREYAKRNEFEDYAVHFGEAVLNPDAAQFKFVADRAPMRAVAIGEALRSELATASASGASPAQTKQLMERLAYIDNEIVPRVHEQLRQMMVSGDDVQKTQAMEYLAAMSNANPEVAAQLTHTQVMTDVLATTQNTDMAKKLLPLVYENIKHLPEDAVRTFDRIYQNGTNWEARSWASRHLEAYPTFSSRTKYLDNQFKHVRGAGNGFWPMDVTDAMRGIDDVSAVAIFEHGYKMADAPSRARVLSEVTKNCKKELVEQLRRRAAAIDAGN